MQNDSWYPAWIRGGHLEDIVQIGKDVLAWCSGIHIVFLNVAQIRQSIFWYWNPDTGDGARCLSAHHRLCVFAFAERAIQPRILVVAYPSMTTISECTGGSISGYIATTFTPGDQLISMGSYPEFALIVWNWKTGVMLINLDTVLRDEVGQVLRTTMYDPTVVAQFGKTCGKLYTWEVHIVENIVISRDHEVLLPTRSPILWADWCPTTKVPLLAIADIDGHVYLSNHDGSDVYRIILSVRCGTCVEVELPRVSWFRDGIVLRTTFCQIRFYTRNVRTNFWRTQWHVKLEARPDILITNPLRKDRFFYYTLEGSLMQLEFSENVQIPKISAILDNGAVYRFVDFIYPWCHHLVAAWDSQELAVLECYEGTRVSTVEMEVDGDISSLSSHPDYPLIALGTTAGELVFLSIIEPSSPVVAARTRLQKSPLDFIKISYSGKNLVAGGRSTGNCYCVSLQRSSMYTVRCLVQVPASFADLLIFEGSKKLRLLVLVPELKSYPVGQHLMLYEVSDEQNLVNFSVRVLDLPGLYRSLCQVPGSPTTLVGSLYSTRQLRSQKLNDFKEIVLLDTMPTGHQVKLANLFADRSWITSAALDGTVVVRGKGIRQVVAQIMTHHRSDLGSLKAMASRSRDLIVSLGKNGSLVAVRLLEDDGKAQPTAMPSEKRVSHRVTVEHHPFERLRKKIHSDYISLDPSLLELLSCPKYEFPDPAMGEKTWTEWRAEQQARMEAEQTREEKEEILKDFGVLKSKVKKLLDVNEIHPEIEKLPVSAFDLDVHGRDQKLKLGRDDCDDLRGEMEHNISEMQRVYTWIRKSFWEPQTIVGKSLYAISGKLVVTNYPAVEDEPLAKDRLQWALFCKDTESAVLENGTFQAWKVYTNEDLQREVTKRMKIYQEAHREIDLLLDDEEDVVSEDYLKQLRAFEGTTTHKYVEASNYYPQLGYYGFGQVTTDNVLLLHDCERLRAYFNAAFDGVYSMKEREMNVIRERIARIRYIDSELRTMFGGSVPHVPAYPDWHWQEHPETIIEVQDHEISVKPYVSPSQQELLDKQAAEEERRRQLLLADDFRERALMAMMDGVLEIRWEDTIKIDVPKPACMLQKEPEAYNADDVAAVKQYEKAVQFLQAERERYRRMMEVEYGKVMGLLQEGIDKFNGKLGELFHLKINIEAAILQLCLRYVRGWLLIRHRMKSFQECDDLERQIAQKCAEERTLRNHLHTLGDVRENVTARCEGLSACEKSIAKKFKTEFSSLNKLNHDLLEPHYKRRPRTNLKNLEATDIPILAGHVISRTPCTYLPPMCGEFLRSLASMDARPSTLPSTIQTSHWESLVRLRRQKIELDLKVRRAQADVSDVEGMIANYEQRIEKCKSDVDGLRRKLVETREQRTMDELDVPIQLVLKMGQVEIAYAGETTNAEDAILISRTQIEAVNKLIGAAGACKLDALSRLLRFQRGTLLKEWKHECRKKQLEDLREDIRFIETVTLTKEMQQYLSRQARGLKDDKTPAQLHEGIETVKRRFEAIAKKHRDRLDTIRKDARAMRRKNRVLDKQILEMNVARCDMEQRRDLFGEEAQRKHAERKMRMIVRRAELIKKLQDNYAEMLELQTEHELLRLKRYPTFHFKMLDGNGDEDRAC